MKGKRRAGATYNHNRTEAIMPYHRYFLLNHKIYKSEDKIIVNLLLNDLYLQKIISITISLSELIDMMYISHQQFLEREVKSLKQLNKDNMNKYAKWRGKCETLEYQIKELREQMNAMKSDRDECFKRNEQLEKENEQLNKRIENLEKKVEALESHIKT